MGRSSRELEAIISIAGQLDPSLARSISDAQKQFGGLKTAMAAVSTAAVAMTAAVVKFGTDAVKSAAEFETQMANVSTLLDGTAEQVSQRIDELSDDVLAVSNSTGVATEELTDGLYQIISAVGDSEDAIVQMELAAKAADAGGATTTDAINLLTAVTKGYGDTSQEAFEKASDLSFMTVKLGQTSFPALASSMGKVVPLASALGVSQEELYGSFATLTGVTGSTAEVATQMKAVMSGLMSPSQDMTAALEQLGYSNANAALESLGLQGTLDALGETVGGDTQKLAKMFSSVEAQTAILSLAGAQSEDFTNKTAAMYEASGATQAAFDKQNDTLEDTINDLKNLGKNFTTSVGRTILPVVKELAQKLLPVVQEMLESLQPVIENLYSALSPVIDIAGDFIMALLPKLQNGIETMASLFAGNFQSGLDTIGSLWDELQPILSNLAEQLMPIFQAVLDDVKRLFEKLAPVVAKFVQNLIPAFGAILEAVIPIIQVLAEAFSPILDMVGKLVESLLPALTNIINFLVPIIQTAAAIIRDTLGNVLSFILPILENIIGAFTSLCDFITNVFTGNWEGAWEAVKSIFSNVFDALEGIFWAPISGIIAIINGVISGINSMGFVIPEWVPVVGGKEFKLDIPEIPMLATGGFTTGASIAGEAGMEAVISFDSAYRDENIGYWAKAGHMLGLDDSLIDAFEAGGYSGDVIEINATFAPNITIYGSEDIELDLIGKLRDEEEEFLDMLEDMLERRGGGQYRANFG